MMMRFLMLLMFVLGTGQKSWSEESTLYNAGIGTWTDSHGKTVALKEFKGHKVVLLMVYTSCQMACPMMSKKLKSIKEKLSGMNINPEFVVISFDTKFDNAKKMEIFGKHHGLVGPDWNLMVGSEKDTRFLSNLLGIRFSRNPKDQTISHDNKIVLIDENGNVVKTLDGLKFDPTESLF